MMFCSYTAESGVESGNCSDGNVRLVDGSNLLGRLEICVNNAWGTVCETQFGLNEARVTCAQLGGTGMGFMYIVFVART